jgi:hypothetical protein
VDRGRCGGRRLVSYRHPARKAPIMSSELANFFSKSVILGDVSTALALQSDPEQASAVLHQAIDLVELTGSGAGKRRVFAAGRQLGPWRNEPFVQEVQDRLLALAC